MGFFSGMLGKVAGGVLGGLLGGGKSRSGTPQVSKVNPFNVNTGLFGSQWDGSNLNTTMAPELSNLQTGSLATAGLFGGVSPGMLQAQQMGQGFLQDLGTFDPMSVGQQQYDLFSDIIGRQQERDRLAQESRLFSQGRLGSTGAGIEQEALRQAQGDVRTKALMDSYGLGLQAQDRLYNMGTGLSQFAPQLQGLYGNLQNTYINQALGIDRAALAPARLGGQLGFISQGSQAPQYSMTERLGQGLLSGAASGIGDYIGNYDFGGSSGLMTTPSVPSVDYTLPTNMFNMGYPYG